jgi:membrane-associated phospholipid phosphatase
VLAVIINLIIQQFFFFERPETLITPILKHIPDASFPSDHTSVSFAFLT